MAPNQKRSDEVKEVIERLFQRMESSSTDVIDKMKKELLAAAESGPEAVQTYFEEAGQALLQEAKGLAGELSSKLGA